MPSFGKTASCVIGLLAFLTLAACDGTPIMASFVNAEQFEKVRALCVKNDGLMSVKYFIVIDHKSALPYVAYCNDGAQFDVPEDIKKRK